MNKAYDRVLLSTTGVKFGNSLHLSPERHPISLQDHLLFVSSLIRSPSFHLKNHIRKLIWTLSYISVYTQLNYLIIGKVKNGRQQKSLYSTNHIGWGGWGGHAYPWRGSTDIVVFRMKRVIFCVALSTCQWRIKYMLLKLNIGPALLEEEYILKCHYLFNFMFCETYAVPTLVTSPQL